MLNTRRANHFLEPPFGVTKTLFGFAWESRGVAHESRSNAADRTICERLRAIQIPILFTGLRILHFRGPH